MKSRNRLQRISFLVLSLAALVHGCAWDDSLYNEFVIETENGRGEVVQCGDSLEKIIIYKGNNASETYCNGCTNGYGKYANAFEYKLCPRDAPNCMREDDDNDQNKTKGTCVSCSEDHVFCEGKCVELATTSQETDPEVQNNHIKFNPILHIESCADNKLVCEDDYYNLDGDVTNGCEFPISVNHVSETDPGKDGSLNCIADYYDLDKKVANGCEFQISVNHVDETDPQNEDGSLKCIADYYDLDKKVANGCEFQISVNHVNETNPKNDNGSWICIADYYDLDEDREGINGCEFQLSVHHVNKENPKIEDGYWICENGYADRDTSRENGCEINGWMDPNHCGAGVIKDGERGVGKECAKDKTCVSGECTVSCGKEGIVECDGYCVNVRSDNDHCGVCGNTCKINDNTSSSTAAVTCGGGYCHATACMPGYRLNVNPNNNDTNNFPNTCTQCNPDEYTTSATATKCEKCPTTPGASTMKFDTRLNMCVPKTCKSGWYYHDPCANSSNNKCTGAAYCDTTQHCTSSDQCANLSAGTSACVNGKCEYACNAGWYYSLNGCTNPPYCCQKCPKGTYNSSTGATQCSIVPAGYVGTKCASGYKGCTSYSNCQNESQCENMYGYYSSCVKNNNSSYYCTDYPEKTKMSCNRSYNGCSNNQTCKPHGNNYDYSYGYCN